MPSRAELKPLNMRSFLRFVSLVDVERDSGIYRVRLQSTHTREVFGELAHRKFGELFPEDVAQRWRDCFHLVRDTGQPVRLWTQVGTQDQFWLQCEVFIAPLSDGADNAEIASLFWVFVSWNRDQAVTAA
jgi:hypothetical protein